MELLILPHQLFSTRYLPKPNEVFQVYLYEHPQYFTKYKYNKKRLVMHRASMKYYYDYLEKNKYNVKYIEFQKKLPNIGFSYFDPIDKINIKGTQLESPNFLLTKEQMDKYNKKTKSFIFYNFYMAGKKDIDIIPDVKSQDKNNRQKMINGVSIPKLPNLSLVDNKYILEAQEYVEKYFKSNYGSVDNFIFPVTHNSAMRWLNHFIKIKLKDFGPYQDFIIPGKSYLFHSVLSPSINIGLLNPLEIIDRLRPLKSKIPLNSYEGYIRQLFWREYQRYTYIYYNFNNKNYFGNNKKLTKEWYNGTTGITPVDDSIKDAFNTGYLHHILRLMVIGNWMNLSGIKPLEGFKWFMEFSCDSYEWVMHQNVLDMVFCVSGGDTMRKPYISSSSYILKMSQYKKGKWSEKWDETFRAFCIKNKGKLYKFRYFFPFLVKMTNKKTKNK